VTVSVPSRWANWARPARRLAHLLVVTGDEHRDPRLLDRLRLQAAAVGVERGLVCVEGDAVADPGVSDRLDRLGTDEVGGFERRSVVARRVRPARRRPIVGVGRAANQRCRLRRPEEAAAVVRVGARRGDRFWRPDERKLRGHERERLGGVRAGANVRRERPPRELRFDPVERNVEVRPEPLGERRLVQRRPVEVGRGRRPLVEVDWIKPLRPCDAIEVERLPEDVGGSGLDVGGERVRPAVPLDPRRRPRNHLRREVVRQRDDGIQRAVRRRHDDPHPAVGRVDPVGDAERLTRFDKRRVAAQRREGTLRAQRFESRPQQRDGVHQRPRVGRRRDRPRRRLVQRPEPQRHLGGFGELDARGSAVGDRRERALEAEVQLRRRGGDADAVAAGRQRDVLAAGEQRPLAVPHRDLREAGDLDPPRLDGHAPVDREVVARRRRRSR